MLTVRVLYINEWAYLFYIWNFILAIIPFLCSRQLAYRQNLNYKAILLMICWLLFFPNAPYLITDILHFENRPPVPAWYDLTLVVSGAWNGLLLGIISLMQVEQFLLRFFKKTRVSLFVFLFIALGGYGVYLGRFMRYNSWDIATRPLLLVSSLVQQLLHPHQHLAVWAFTLVFSVMLGILYTTVKQLPLWTDRT